VRNLSFFFGDNHVLKSVSLDIAARAVTAIIGPSGCGKSTFLRALNGCTNSARSPDDRRKFACLATTFTPPGIESVVVRRPRRHGVPEIESVPDHVHHRQRHGRPAIEWPARSASCSSSARNNRCAMAALWDEVKDRLNAPAPSAFGRPAGNDCASRAALAVQPEVLLMDEPASALDPLATSKIEDLILELKKDYTIVIVTHNMQQAARMSDFTAFLLSGRPGGIRRDQKIFTSPAKKQTEDYVTGRFG